MPPAKTSPSRFRKAALGAAACLLGPFLSAHGEDAPLPTAIPADRYQSLWSRSPFSIASASSDAAQGTWALIGLTQDGDSSLAFLLNRQSQERMTVTKQPNEKGFSIEAAEFNPDVLQSSVRIKTPSETLTLRFDAALTQVNSAPLPSAAPPISSGQLLHPTPGTAAASVPPRKPITRTIIPSPLSGTQPPSP